MSSGDAASTDVISDSSLENCQGKVGEQAEGERNIHLGLILVILAPELDFTNSLLMNKPVGKVILVPLGAVSSTWRSDMVDKRWDSSG